MRARSAVPALLLAAVTVSVSAACDNTRAGAKQDAEIAAEQAKQAGEKAAEATADAARDAGQATREAGEAVAEGAAEVKDQAALAAAASTTTGSVKSALMADRSVDSSNVDVDTDAARRVVTLRGSVPSAAQRVAAERIARAKASGYEVVNDLRIVG